MENLRKHKRFKTELIFTYDIPEGEIFDPEKLQPMGTAGIKNISHGGAKISSFCEFPVGIILNVTLTPFVTGAYVNEHVKIRGKVVWSMEASPDAYNCGIQFFEFIGDSKKLLDKYVSDLATYSGKEKNAEVSVEDIEEF
ncbi:MAG: PilZ domain-containing protein [Desulfobulbaceae bacterium]|nr:PilZ domain-containing protein [Desulfobulbaceae bacterium]